MKMDKRTPAENEQIRPDAKLIEEIYDKQAQQFSSFAENSFSWKYIEQPALERYLTDLIKPNMRVLDVGVGAGRVIRLLTQLGIPEENITGFDISGELLKIARVNFPAANFFKASADDFDLPPESVDLVTANMVFQYLDNEMLIKTADNIYKTLKSDGKLVFIETHPLHSEEARKGENNNQWINLLTPWGLPTFIFNRDPWSLLDTLELGGFNIVGGWETLKISEEGRADGEQFEHYSSYRPRAGYVCKKIDLETKQLRNDPNYRIPSLLD